MLPVGQAGDHDLVQVGGYPVEGLGPLGSLVGQLGRHLAGLDRLPHRPLVQPGQVVGDPVDHPVPVAPELVEVQRAAVSFQGMPLRETRISGLPV